MPVALFGVLAAAGCGGNSAASQIRIPPAKGRPTLPPRDAVVMAQEDGTLAVALAARPAASGIELIATIVGPDNQGKDGLQVEFGKRNVTKTGKPCGSGCYSAQLPVSGPGEVSVRVSGRTLEFKLPARWPPDATALVRRATAVFNRLDSVRYREALASSPQTGISTLWTQVAPNRLEYSIRGGADGIVIGRTRWDRATPSARWVKSAIQPITAPAPLWGSRNTNARLLSRTKDSYVVSLLNRSIPAWFTISLDRKLLPRSLDMTAAAHFMHHDYLSFNRPLQIEPPR